MADYFHSEGRQISALRRRNPNPLVEINPNTAAKLGFSEGDWVWIETPHGRVTMRARLFDGIAENVVSAQHAWWFPEEAAPEHGWKKSSINLTFGEMDYDPETGSESLKSMLVEYAQQEIISHLSVSRAILQKIQSSINGINRSCVIHAPGCPGKA